MLNTNLILRSSHAWHAQDRLLGIDVSHHQGEMDFSTAYEAGARFCLVRAGSITEKSGECYRDYRFAENARKAPEVMLTGYYWYFRPQYSPVLQMNYFCDLLEKVDISLRPELDVEVSCPRMVIPLKKALELLEARLGMVPLLYCRGEFWNTHLGLLSWAKNYPLHIARYTTDPHPWLDKSGKLLPRVKPVAWDEWTFWQFSADGNLRGKEFGARGSHSIDLDWFNGSQADLLRFSGDPHPDPLPEGEGAGGWKESIDAWARTMGYKGPRP